MHGPLNVKFQSNVLSVTLHCMLVP